MGYGNFKLYLFLGVLGAFVVMPIIKSALQEASIGQDIRSIEMEYSMYGRGPFRARLEEIVERAPLNLARVEIKMQEKRPQAKVLIEIRYASQMKFFMFLPLNREVVISQEIPLVPL